MIRTTEGRQRSGPEAAGTDSQRIRRSGARRKRLFCSGGVALIVGLVVYGLFATNLVRGAEALGELAPDISLATADGGFVLSEHQGKVVVLYFSFPG